MPTRPDVGPRTHEPSLREITAELDGFRELVLSKLDASDRLYKERDDSRRTAVEAALKAAEVLTNAAFAASEKAIVKAEEAQRAYNTSHNDLAKKMEDQNKATMPRSETEARFHSLEEKVNDLRTANAAVGGHAQGGQAVKDEGRANMAMLIAVAGVLLALWSHFGGIAK